MKTTWKYSSGTSSRVRAATQRSRALRLALGAVAIAAGVEGEAEIFAAVEQRSRWRPSAAVRQRSMARMTLCCGQEMRARLRSTKRAAVCAEDVGHLQRGLAHDAAGSSLARRGWSVSSGFGADRSGGSTRWR